MIVVSNSSPIITLATIQRLDILQHIYGHIIIPQAVFDELTYYQEMPGSRDVQTAQWITHQSVVDTTSVTRLLDKLHIGEAEAITLALEMSADVLLMDEQRGRRIASNMGLPVTGVLGTLIAAKMQAIIPLIQPVLDELIHVAGFRIDHRLYTQLLHIADE